MFPSPEDILGNDLDTVLLAFAIGEAPPSPGLPVLAMRTTLPPVGEHVVIASARTEEVLHQFTHMPKPGGPPSTYVVGATQRITHPVLQTVAVTKNPAEMPDFMQFDEAWLWTILMRIDKNMRSRAQVGTRDHDVRGIVELANRTNVEGTVSDALTVAQELYSKRLGEPRIAGLIQASMAVACCRMGMRSLHEQGFNPWDVIAGFRNSILADH